MQNLTGKTAFVTGCASGIGLGIAKALLGAGMRVVTIVPDTGRNYLSTYYDDAWRAKRGV